MSVAYCGVCGTDVHIYHEAMDGRVGPPKIIIEDGWALAPDRPGHSVAAQGYLAVTDRCLFVPAAERDVVVLTKVNDLQSVQFR